MIFLFATPTGVVRERSRQPWLGDGLRPQARCAECGCPAFDNRALWISCMACGARHKFGWLTAWTWALFEGETT